MRLFAAAIALPLLLCLPLAACGGGSPDVPQDFRPLNFGYLTPLRLNVGTVSVQDNAAAAAVPGDIAQRAPEPPDQALARMANQRLIATGGAAQAVFSIDRASIVSDGDTLSGNLAVHLDIIGANGAHAGFAQAQVSRQFSGSGRSQAALYALTKQMLADMNVEFEYQVRRSLKDWVLSAGGASGNVAITSQALPPPGAPAAVAAPVAPAPAALAPTTPAPTTMAPTTLAPTTLAPTALAPVATPVATVPGTTLPAPAGTTLASPRPGYLVAPPGAVAGSRAPSSGVVPPSTFDEPSNLPQAAPSTANPAPNSQPWGY